jgi:hypothetical protein
MPSDPGDALKWALDHTNVTWWVIAAIAAGVAWTNKRLRDWNRRNALNVGPAKVNAAPAGWTPGTPSAPPPPRPQQPSAPSAYTAATAYAAPAYAAQAAYAPPPGGGATPGGPARRLHRDAPPAQRAATPVARSVDVPVATGAWTLAGAFGDPAHARTAIVIAEVLGPPVGLR